MLTSKWSESLSTLCSSFSANREIGSRMNRWATCCASRSSKPWGGGEGGGGGGGGKGVGEGEGRVTIHHRRKICCYRRAENQSGLPLKIVLKIA